LGYSYILPMVQSGAYEYNVSFAAPSLQCTNITDTMDFDSYLPYSNNASAAIVVWNSTYRYDPDTPASSDDPFEFYVATRTLGQTYVSDISNGTENGRTQGLEGVACSPYNSTYHVTVRNNDTNAIQVNSIETHGLYSSALAANATALQPLALPDILAWSVKGTVLYTFDTDTSSGNLNVANSQLRLKDQPDPWRWRGTMLTILPNLMQLISLSVLSGQPSSWSPTTGYMDPFTPVNTTCVDDNLRYIYRRARLLITYSTALACTTLLVGLGSIVVARNRGAGETLEFSRMVGSTMYLKDDTSLDTRVQAEDVPHGILFPAP